MAITVATSRSAGFSTMPGRHSGVGGGVCACGGGLAGAHPPTQQPTHPHPAPLTLLDDAAALVDHGEEDELDHILLCVDRVWQGEGRWWGRGVGRSGCQGWRDGLSHSAYALLASKHTHARTPPRAACTLTRELGQRRALAHQPRALHGWVGGVVVVLCGWTSRWVRGQEGAATSTQPPPPSPPSPARPPHTHTHTQQQPTLRDSAMSGASSGSGEARRRLSYW